MSKKAKIAELEYRLGEAEKQIGVYVKKIESYEDAQNAIPEDCTPGAWCEACAFVGVVPIHIYDYNPHSPFACSKTVKLRICAKGKCKNFVAKEDPNDS